MQLYSDKDVELVNLKIDNIIDKIENKKLDLFEPTRKEIMEINDVIMEYIKLNKRKIYGGYAQNKLIILKNPSAGFYSENQLPDIDVYSPDPIKDLINMCNILHKKGYKYVLAEEAVHKETYKIHVNFENVCDLSYVPLNIYNRIPFIECDGIHYVKPSFIYIDMYRIITEPYFSYDRWKKIFPRLKLLQKYYPINKATKNLNNAYNVPKKNSEIVMKINDFVIDEMKNKNNFIVVGQYAYNQMLEYSKIIQDKKFNKKYKIINIPFLQVISTNYISDTVHMIINIKKFLNELADNITFTEFYPLWMFTGYSTVIYYDSIPILHITSHNDRCVQTKQVHVRKYGNNITEKDNNIQLGCFDLVLLMNLTSGLRARVNFLDDRYQYHNIMTSHLVEMRNYYLNKNKKTLLDNTLFESFMDTCVGSTISPLRKHRLEKNKKFKENKKVAFRYDPERPKDAPDYKFANRSGNLINKVRNYKITKFVNSPELLSNNLSNNLSSNE